MGPTPKEKKKIKQKETKREMGGRTYRVRESVQRVIFFKFLSFQIFFLRFMETCPSDFVGINPKSALCDEGYA